MDCPIRVLLVDDSGFARSLLRGYLDGDPAFVVAGEAGNGRDAVALTRELRPDLVTMDLEMPVMGGLEAIEEIMSSCAVPILVVSSVADAQNALNAVARGALDVIAKPGLDDEEIAAFLAKAKLVAKVKVITHVRARQTAAVALAEPVPLPADPAPPAADRLFAIACSTGGPQALAHLLPQLPAGFPCPVVIAQHISDGFAPGMAQWLSHASALPVRIGGHGEALQPGVIYLSPSEANMTVTRARHIAIQPRADGQLYHPSCDALLSSVAHAAGRLGVGIILTGMGSDGVAGLAEIRAGGGVTIAQDEASSVIFGMNRIAIERGGAGKVLPLDDIAAEMVRLAHHAVREGAAR